MENCPSKNVAPLSHKKNLKQIVRLFCREWIENSYAASALDEQFLQTICSCAARCTLSILIELYTHMRRSSAAGKNVRQLSLFSPSKILIRMPEWRERFLPCEWKLLEEEPAQFQIISSIYPLIEETAYDLCASPCAGLSRDVSHMHWMNLYEETLSWRLTAGSKEYDIKNNYSICTREGKYYTPQPIVRYIVQSVLEPLCRGKSPEDILTIKVLDPAMGCGQFLQASAEFLTGAIMKKLKSDGKRLRKDSPLSNREYQSVWQSVVINCLYGVDIDPFAVFLSQWLLGDVLSFDSGGQIPQQISSGTKKLRDHLKTGNSLVGTVREREGKNNGDSYPAVPFHWWSEFPEVFRHHEGFHAVVGNPPWVSFGLRGTGALQKDYMSYYKAQFRHSAEYKVSSFALFMERSMELLAVGGYHSFIIPDSFLSGRYFSKIRKYCLQMGEFRKIVLLDKVGWKGIHTGRNVVYLIHKPDIRKKSVWKRKGKESISATVNGFSPKGIEAVFVKNEHELLECTKGYIQKFHPFLKAHPHRICLLFDKSQESFVNAMLRKSISLGQVIEFYSGLIGKNGKKSIVLPPGNDNNDDKECGLLIESGKNLGSYRLAYRGYRIRKNPGIYKSGYTPEIYENPKIFLNQTGYILKSCVDTEGFYCLNNLHVGYAIDRQYSLAFIAALLNSKIVNTFYQILSMEYNRPLAQTDIETIETLPIPHIPFSISEENRIAWMQLFPYGAIELDVSLQEGRSFQSSSRNRLIANTISGILRHKHYAALFGMIKKEAGDGKTVLHDWIHIAASLIMEYYRHENEKKVEYCALSCPGDIAGSLIWNGQNMKDDSKENMLDFIEKMVNYLYTGGQTASCMAN